MDGVAKMCRSRRSSYDCSFSQKDANTLRHRFILLDASVRSGERRVHRQSRSLTDRDSGVSRVSMVAARVGA